MTHHKAEYEIREQRDDKILVDIWVETQKRPISHGIPLHRAKERQGDLQEFIEEEVARIAEKFHQDQFDQQELPNGGTVEYERKEPRIPPSERSGEEE